jgi:AcrR family transcriptional regulator
MVSIIVFRASGASDTRPRFDRYRTHGRRLSGNEVAMTTGAARRTDRRVQRTRRALRDALVALILERGWDGFGIQELCERADVGRSTFYMHFADKEELVAGNFEDLRKALRAQLAETGTTGRPLAFSRGLVEHAHDHRRLFLAVVGKKSGLVVQRRFRDLVLDLVHEDLDAALPPGQTRDATVAFLAGAFLEVLTWALESKSPPSADDTDRLFRELADPILARLPAPQPPPRRGGR